MNSGWLTLGRTAESWTELLWEAGTSGSLWKGPRYSHIHSDVFFPRLRGEAICEISWTCLSASQFSALHPGLTPSECWLNTPLKGLEIHTQVQLSRKLIKTSSLGSTLTEVYLHWKWNASSQKLKRGRKDELELEKITCYTITIINRDHCVRFLLDKYDVSLFAVYWVFYT